MHASVVAKRCRVLIAAILLASLMIGAAAQTTGATSSASPASPSEQLRAAIAAVLPSDSGRGVPRLPSVRIDPTGDATVVFALREGDTAPEIVDRGLADILTIFRAVYHPAAVASVRTTTVIGTYAVTGQYGTREWPVMRAVLSRQAANRLDWNHLSAGTLRAALDTWWVYPPLLAAEPDLATPDATLAATPGAETSRWTVR